MGKQYAFAALQAGAALNRDTGTMTGVSLMSEGPALGHGLQVDERSLETLMETLDGTRLAAYITHRGALFEDRLTREIGMFDNFRIEEDRMLADFQAFESFMEDEPRRFRRLFELAEKMPENFGLSIVFAGDLAWATPNGDVEVDFDETDMGRPEDARFNEPSIRVTEVSSGDFVDQPAANARGLFTAVDLPSNRNMTKAELETKIAELLDAQEKAAKETEELRASLEKAASERDAANEALDGYKQAHDYLEEKVAEQTKQLESATEKDKELSGRVLEFESAEKEYAEKLDAKQARIVELEAALKGSQPVQDPQDEGGDAKYVSSKSLRAKVIAEYAKEHGITEFAATLRLGAERPELWKS